MHIAKTKKGIALFIAMGFLALFSTISVLYIATITSDYKLTKKSTYSAKAFYLAESGIQKALYKLRNDYTWAGEGPVDIDWAGASKGEYEVTAIDAAGNQKQVISTGYFPHKTGAYARRSIEAYISPPTPDWFFGNAIVAGENVDLNGSYTVNGDILYGNSIDPEGLGEKFDAAFPLLDFEQLRALAVSQIKPDGQNNLYTQADIESGKTFPSSFWFDEVNSIPNIVYIETNLVLRGNVDTLGGFYIVAGDVLTNPDSVDVDTTINGNGTIDGCVYTLGDFSINGGGNGLGVTGGVWARDEVRLNGNADVSYNANYMNAIDAMNISFKAQIISWRESY